MILLLALVTTAPVPFGAVTQPGILKLELMAFGTAALAMFTSSRRFGAAALPLVLVLCIALVGAVQLIPADDSALRRLSPVSASVFAETNEVLRLFDTPPIQPRISIVPADTTRATLLIVAYAACFVSAYRLLRTRVRRRVFIVTLLASAAIQVFHATIVQTPQVRVHGQFVNPNHFAGYLEVALCLAFALLWIEIITGRERVSPRAERSERIERRLVALTWRVLVWVILAVGIALTRSRLGIAAAILTTILLLACSAVHRRTRGRRYAVAAGTALAVALGLVASITREIPLLRFLASDPRDPESDSRFRLWRLSLDAWQNFPTFGSGLGTFREAFKRVQPSDFPGLYEQAHNDALQLLVTGGWISLTLAALALGTMFVLLIRGWARQRRREEAAVTLAAAAALFSLLVHGIAEFNFSIPAIPATLAMVLGCGWAAANDDPSGQMPVTRTTSSNVV